MDFVDFDNITTFYSTQERDDYFELKAALDRGRELYYLNGDIHKSLTGKTTEEKVEHLKLVKDQLPDINELKRPLVGLSLIWVRAIDDPDSPIPASEIKARSNTAHELVYRREEFADSINDFYNDELEHFERIKGSAIQGAQKKDPLEIIDSCATKLGINDPSKRDVFTGYVKTFLHPSDPRNPKRLIIIYDPTRDREILCFYDADKIPPDELNLRKILIAFAYILKDDIVDRPKNSGEIPSTKYAEAFSYTLDGKTSQPFFKEKISSQALIPNPDLINRLKKELRIIS